MALHNTPAERQIIKLLEKVSLPEEEAMVWIDQIQSAGMNEDLAEQIQERLNHPAQTDPAMYNRSIMVVEFTRLVRQWRMAQGARKFNK
jgi:hypothetical protein